MANTVLGYGVVLVGLVLVLQRVAPALAKVTFIAGLVGGGLSVLWGIVARAGHKRRTWAVLTLIALGFVVLTQVLNAWSASAGETPGKLAGALLLTLLMLLTVGLIMYLLHGERTAEFYRTEPARRNNSEPRQEAAPSQSARRR